MLIISYPKLVFLFVFFVLVSFAYVPSAYASWTDNHPCGTNYQFISSDTMTFKSTHGNDSVWWRYLENDTTWENQVITNGWGSFTISNSQFELTENSGLFTLHYLVNVIPQWNFLYATSNCVLPTPNNSIWVVATSIPIPPPVQIPTDGSLFHDEFVGTNGTCLEADGELWLPVAGGICSATIQDSTTTIIGRTTEHSGVSYLYNQSIDSNHYSISLNSRVLSATDKDNLGAGYEGGIVLSNNNIYQYFKQSFRRQYSHSRLK